MKIYIIGAVGSGKTTLAKNISSYFNILHFELDDIVWDNNKKEDRKRSDEEIKELFLEIINRDNWIIEDIGRRKFNSAYEKTDIIIFMSIPKHIRDYRLLKRWIYQKTGKLKSNYKPTLNMLYNMYVWSKADEKSKPEKLYRLNQYKEKVLYINNEDLKKLDNIYLKIEELINKEGVD